MNIETVWIFFKKIFSPSFISLLWICLFLDRLCSVSSLRGHESLPLMRRHPCHHKWLCLKRHELCMFFNISWPTEQRMTCVWRAQCGILFYVFPFCVTEHMLWLFMSLAIKRYPHVWIIDGLLEIKSEPKRTSSSESEASGLNVQTVFCGHKPYLDVAWCNVCCYSTYAINEQMRVLKKSICVAQLIVHACNIIDNKLCWLFHLLPLSLEHMITNSRGTGGHGLYLLVFGVLIGACCLWHGSQQ